MPNQSSLAKLTRPRLHGTVARERLFAVLDEARNRTLVCVVGPPGAGKTTLVATWLEARRIPGIWYLGGTGKYAGIKGKGTFKFFSVSPVVSWDLLEIDYEIP